MQWSAMVLRASRSQENVLFHRILWPGLVDSALFEYVSFFFYLKYDNKSAHLERRGGFPKDSFGWGMGDVSYS